MRKILAILATIGISATAVSAVVSCSALSSKIDETNNAVIQNIPEINQQYASKLSNDWINVVDTTSTGSIGITQKQLDSLKIYNIRIKYTIQLSFEVNGHQVAEYDKWKDDVKSFTNHLEQNVSITNMNGKKIFYNRIVNPPMYQVNSKIALLTSFNKDGTFKLNTKVFMWNQEPNKKNNNLHLKIEDIEFYDGEGVKKDIDNNILK